jgi:hypothetical protein
MTSKINLTAPRPGGTIKSPGTIAEAVRSLPGRYGLSVPMTPKKEIPMAHVQDLSAIFRMAGRHFLPSEAVVISEYDQQRNRTRLRVQLPVKATKPGEHDKHYEVSHELDDAWFNPKMGPREVAEIASKIMQDAADQFQQQINADRRPNEDVLALLAMARLDARYEHRQDVWRVFPLDQDPRNDSLVPVDAQIDSDADEATWRHLVTSIIDMKRLRDAYPHLRMQLGRDYAPKSKMRDISQKMEYVNAQQMKQKWPPSPYDMPDQYAQEMMRRQIEQKERYIREQMSVRPMVLGIDQGIATALDDPTYSGKVWKV